MHYRFNEGSLIVIPFILKGYRLEDGEKIRFCCMFKTENGDYPYSLCFDEDNKNETGKDGHYTMTLDMRSRGILPGRYSFSLELVMASGSSITLKNMRETMIEVIPSPHEEGCACHG